MTADQRIGLSPIYSRFDPDDSCLIYNEVSTQRFGQSIPKNWSITQRKTNRKFRLHRVLLPTITQKVCYFILLNTPCFFVRTYAVLDTSEKNAEIWQLSRWLSAIVTLSTLSSIFIRSFLLVASLAVWMSVKCFKGILKFLAEQRAVAFTPSWLLRKSYFTCNW